MTEHNPEDYVLVHKSKARISRARKVVMGLMAVGALAAVGGAGTFASFSASTTNDASFKTGRIVLKDTKTAGTACFSDGVGASGTENAANLDVNDNGCAVLFGNTLKPGDTATASLTLENKGDSAATLNLFGVAACANSNNTSGPYAGPFGTGNLCSTIKMYVQETNSSFVPLTSCVYPASAVAACDATFATTFDTMANFPATFANTIALSPAVPVDGARYFVVATKMPDTGFSGGGIGNDNPFQRRQATLNLRWLLQG
jgi:predicted ribosomally synthesized peptide with SipW-like signal peptide